ncbi:tRNA (adenosine(37)-N6)-dimethylallyltransferase MiaA [Jonesiaceae bacterium BS-20]|uniref:tRNA dimethylallyltransferase n=1 Tax=Jonesiaceae bacterium BS-20 TaxID=3120821 RepID=A0AAU7DWK5_9MICO
MVIVAVVGPTATGKSDLALDLAQRLSGNVPAEIVNSDAYQMYRQMDIGTAKVPIAQRRGIVHHQVDVLEVSQDASVADFQTRARADLAAIAQRGARAVVVGGSGLYVRALLDHMDFPGTDPLVRAALERECEELGVGHVFAQLEAKDPVAARNIGSQNARRIIRALEVIELTGQPYSANLPRQEYVAPAVQIGLDCDREFLDAQVANRVDLMFEQGLVQEVTALAQQGLGRTAERAVGYAEILSHLRGEITLDQARADITANTRRLARKQMGWFGRDPRVQWLNAQDPDRIEKALAIVARADSGETLGGIEMVRRPLGS